MAKEASNSQSYVVAAGLVAVVKEGAGLATLEAKPGAVSLRESSILGELHSVANDGNSASEIDLKQRNDQTCPSPRKQGKV